MLQRLTISKDVTVTTSATTTEEIIISEYAAGLVFIKSGSITSLTYHATNKVGGTYSPAQDSAGTAITQTVAANKAYALPAALFGAYAIKIVADAAGVLSMSLKS